jgi:hypothetical protein
MLKVSVIETHPVVVVEHCHAAQRFDEFVEVVKMVRHCFDLITKWICSMKGIGERANAFAFFQ